MNPLGRQGGKIDHFHVSWYFVVGERYDSCVHTKGYSPIVIEVIYYITIDASLPCSFEYVYDHLNFTTCLGVFIH